MRSRTLPTEGVPKEWQHLDVEVGSAPLLSMHMRHDDLELRLYTAITTLGSAQDIALQELRVETFFPADAESDAQLRRLAEAGRTTS